MGSGKNDTKKTQNRDKEDRNKSEKELKIITKKAQLK